MASSDSVVGLRTLGTTIGCHVTCRDDDLTFSWNCDVVGSHEGHSSQYISIKILNNEGIQNKRSDMMNQKRKKKADLYLHKKMETCALSFECLLVKMEKRAPPESTTKSEMELPPKNYERETWY